MPRIGRHIVCAACSTLLLVALATPGETSAAPVDGQPDREPREYEIKAAFLYHFMRFVEWPDEDELHELTLCVVGSDPFGAALDSLDGQAVRGKTIAVRRIDAAGTTPTCHLVFVPGDQPSAADRDELARLRSLGVLTVGEGRQFTQAGGMIRLYKTRNRIRFEVNLDVARQSGLKISSRMLKLAKII